MDVPYTVNSPCPSCPEDPANKIKRAMTMDAISHSGRCGVTESEARNAPNAERDLHRRFKRSGLSLQIPIKRLTHSFEDGGTLTTEHVDPSDWLTELVGKYCCLLAGGKHPVGDQLRGFWELYKYHHPGHEVFERHGSRLDRVWPLCFFGDEGKGARRSNFMEGTIECPLGLWESDDACDCSSCLEAMPTHWLPEALGPVSSTPNLDAVRNMCSNYDGHSYLKRYLLFGIPAFEYDTKPEIIQNHLDRVASNLADLFNNGFWASGVHYHAALIGSKGDLKFQKEIQNLTRSYANMGRTRALHMCSLCKAGVPEYPMEDTQLEPAWRHSLFSDRPWLENEPPSFDSIPFDPTCPELLYRLDFFHVFKVGLGRDICGSAIVWLAKLQVWDLEGGTRNLPDRLTRGHGHFKLWALSQHKSPALRSFTKSFLNVKSSKSAAWSNSKGSDTLLLLKWLRFVVGLLLVDEAPQGDLAQERSMLRLLHQMIEHSLQMCDLIYSHKLFLPRDCAAKLYLHMMIVLRSYKRMAKDFVDQGVSGFRLKPKFHALMHIAYDLRCGLKQGTPLLLSPITFGCEPNEDHTGRVSRLSRTLATKTLGLRLTQRYFLKSKALFRRHLQLRREKGLPR